MLENRRPGFRSAIASYRLDTGSGRIPYGLGCAWLGQGEGWRERLGGDVGLVEQACESGFRYFDTSEYYGQSEVVLGEFLRSRRGKREGLFLATKSRVPHEGDPGRARIHMVENLKRSLERLGARHIDLFQIHDVQTLSHILAPGGPLEALLDLRERGTIHGIGLATRDLRLLEQAVHHGAFDTVLTYSDFTPLDDSARDLIRTASRHGLAVINGSPLCHGLLTGQPPKKERNGRRARVAARFKAFCRERGVPVLAAALKYPLTNPGITINLTGPARTCELETSLLGLNREIPGGFWKDWKDERERFRG